MVIVTLVISASFILSRQWLGDLKFNNKVISAKNQVNSTLSQNVDSLGQLQQNYTAMQQSGLTASQVLAALPTAPAYADFSNDVEAMAALAGIQLTSVVQSSTDLSTPTATASSLPVQFQIVANGKYKNIQKFLQNLQDAKKPVIIDVAGLSGVDPAVSLQLTVTTFYQPVTTITNDKKVLKE